MTLRTAAASGSVHLVGAGRYRATRWGAGRAPSRRISTRAGGVSNGPLRRHLAGGQGGSSRRVVKYSTPATPPVEVPDAPTPSRFRRRPMDRAQCPFCGTSPTTRRRTAKLVHSGSLRYQDGSRKSHRGPRRYHHGPSETRHRWDRIVPTSTGRPTRRTSRQAPWPPGRARLIPRRVPRPTRPA